jgi:hypothetical protein
MLWNSSADAESQSENVIASVLSAFAHLGPFNLGRWVHDHASRNKRACARNAEVPKKRNTKTPCHGTRSYWQTIGSEEDALNVFWAMLTEGFRPAPKAKLVEELLR